MVKINLSRPVRLHLDVELSKAVEQAHGLTGMLDLPAGVQEVDEAVAEHWFVKAHCEPLPDAPAQEASDDGQGEQDRGGEQSDVQNPEQDPAREPEPEQAAAPEKATKKASK